jgi:hypothetical protein
MSELMRFRLARAPQKSEPDPDNFVYIDLDKPKGDQSTSDKSDLSSGVDPKDKNPIASALTRHYANSRLKLLKQPVNLGTRITELEQWLTQQQNQPSIPALTKILIHLARDGKPNTKDPTTKDVKIDELEAEVQRLTAALEQLKADDTHSEDEPLENIDALREAAQDFISTAGTKWAADRRNIGFSLIVSLFQKPTSASSDFDDLEPSFAIYLNRLMLVIGLVELLAKVPTPIRNRQDIYDALRWRIVVIPKAVLTLLRKQATKSILARRPGFSDLYVVREEWTRYVAGEIAHIENVMASEVRERLHQRLTESEETVTIEEEENTLDERETETTDRFELQEEVTRDSSMNLALDGSVDTSGQYGPTKVDTHLGGSLDYSLDESRSQATTTSRETVARAVVRVEKKVKQARTTRSLTRILEKNRHAFKNDKDGAQHIVGIYRWVDKIKTVQIFRYPNRFLMEFQVPEPGAWLRWLLDSPKREATIAEKPEPLKIIDPILPPPPPPGRPPPPPTKYVDLTPTLITASNYLELGARYKTLGLVPPPAKEVIATVITPTSKEEKTETNPSPKTFVTNTTLTVPSGYVAVSWEATIQARKSSTFPGSLKLAVGSGPSLTGTDFDFLSVAQITAQMRRIIEKALISTELTGLVGQLKGELTNITYGSVPAVVMAEGLQGFNIGLTIHCDPTPETEMQWKIDTYEKIAGAYYEMKQRYDEEIAARDVRAGVKINGQSPLRNAEMAREEMKKLVIEMLMGADFTGRNAVTKRFNADGEAVHDNKGKPLVPEVDLNEAKRVATEIQFIEQVFEWENMTYVLYPYFWTGKEQWDKLADLSGEDPDFARFLRAGSARVVLPARPKFEFAAMLYLYTGALWGGGPAPAPDDKLYFSIANEIRAQQQPPEDGEPGESWEVRLPTTLVWLDNTNSSLPVVKPECERELDTPPPKVKKQKPKNMLI